MPNHLPGMNIADLDQALGELDVVRAKIVRRRSALVKWSGSSFPRLGIQNRSRLRYCPLVYDSGTKVPNKDDDAADKIDRRISEKTFSADDYANTESVQDLDCPKELSIIIIYILYTSRIPHGFQVSRPRFLIFSPSLPPLLPTSPEFGMASCK
ncbi:hypothetical protein FQN54_007626 [Arachnomyces sp. PD_36]|nr:hypothetical protein FQN54_007626 [Arachnomyces sp. PD_36]